MTKEEINLLPQQETHPLPTERPRLKKRWIVFVVLLGVLFTGWLVVRAFAPPPPQDPQAYDPVTLEPVKPKGLFERVKHFVFRREMKLVGERDDRINILLLGMGGVGHDGPFLTDTMIIASLKPSTKQVGMISIPRDLGVKIPGHGWRKINYANALGEAEEPGSGPQLAAQVVEETFDLDIHYYVRVDFQAFEDIVDDMGGITIDVEKSFTDAMFPAANEQYQALSFEKGVQTMSGKRALQYARSRHGNNGEGSDFARAKRQQKVLLAFKEKLLSFGTLAHPLRIKNMLKTLDNHVATNLSFADMIGFIKLARSFDNAEPITVVLDNSEQGLLKNGSSPDGAFILESKSGNFDEINTLIHNIFATDQDQALLPTPVQTPPPLTPAALEVQNGTWNAGLAARIKKQLEDQKFHVVAIGNTTERPQAKSAIVTLNTKQLSDVVKALQDELQIPIKEKPPQLTTTSTADILIILGDDFIE